MYKCVAILASGTHVLVLLEKGGEASVYNPPEASSTQKLRLNMCMCMCVRGVTVYNAYIHILYREIESVKCTHIHL
jgi:hypothetical protein